MGKIEADMSKAYGYGAFLAEKKLEQENPEEAGIIRNLVQEELIVVPGQYDSIEQVLGKADIPFSKRSLLRKPEEKEIIFVNCPGSFSQEELEKLESLVANGSFVVTTDWALKNVVEQVFPGFVEYNKKNTSDDVVQIELPNPRNKYVKGMFKKGQKPLWWLESSSYPIKVLDKKEVEVLITSKEMKRKYGENPIAVTFPYGDGRVFHITSHFKLQRTEHRDKRHSQSSLDFALQDLGLTEKDVAEITQELQGMSLAAIESAYTSIRFIYNIIVDKYKNKT